MALNSMVNLKSFFQTDTSRKKKQAIVALFLILAISLYALYLQKKPARPNILLITIDALRADHLGCYGYARNTSANIDRLAKEGVRFTQAISQSTLTIPSLPSLMTSLYPSQHGITKIFQTSSIIAPTLAGILKENNYHTGAIIAHFLEHTGIKKGFDSAVFVSPLDYAYTSDKVTKKAINWINQNRDKRFFLWLHYMDPHEPFTPPHPYDEIFLSEKSKENGKEFLKKKYYWVDPSLKPSSLILPPITIQTGRGNLNEEDKEYYIAQYDGEIRFTDEQIGLLLDELKKLGLKKKTLLIVSADHGENLADYNNYFAHGINLNDNQLKVPLIITYHGLPGNKIIKRQVQLIDIMPTILDILGIKKDITIEGKSLLPFIFSKEDAAGQYAFSELFGVMTSIRTDDWKLIFYSDKNRYELYNLKSDPDERNNLAESKSEKLESLKKELNNWINRIRQGGSRSPSSRYLPEDIKEKLRSLGYAQ